MHLFFVKIIFLYCVCSLSNGLELLEGRTEFSKREEISSLTKNESSMWIENGLTELLAEQPNAVVVELKEALLDKVKVILDQESEMNYPFKRTLLGTFDSLGLQDISVHNDTFEIRQAIMSLQPAINERGNFTPTFHVLMEILQKDLFEGSVVLVTMTKPNDEDIAQNLIRSLTGKKIKLSVFWVGNSSSDDYSVVKMLTETTGGKFRYITSDNSIDENLIQTYLPKADFENLSEKIKFPEDEKEDTDEEAPLVSRVANQKVFQKTVVPLIVEVASGTNLEARPGTVSQIQFNVKNNINVALPVTFNAKFNGILQNVQPPQAFLQPSSSVTVIVNLQPLGSPQSVNAIGTLTLLAISANKVTPRSALIFMTPQVWNYGSALTPLINFKATTDNKPPKIYYKYEGDCQNYKEPQNCEHGHWSLEATLQDEDSGLLKVLSEPYGLLFQSEFVAGTKSPITVYYSATCCQPNTIIWAEDLKGNYVKKSFDVFNQNLLAGEIASIVLGVLLFIFIIIIIIVGVIMYKRRNQRNLIIPSLRSNNS